jgi:hypothetical protein
LCSKWPHAPLSKRQAAAGMVFADASMLDESVCSICRSEDKITQDKLLVNNLCGHRL